MFELESLQKDKELVQLCLPLLPNEYGELGRFIDVTSIDMLFERLVKARFERLKFLPISKLTIYKTADVGPGYINYMSILAFQELMALRLVDKEIPIHLEYKHGNIFTSVKSVDLNPKVLFTEDTYLLVKEETNTIHSIKIGKPCNPNLLYYRSELDNIVTTIKKLVTIENVNSIWIKEDRDSPL